MGSHSINKLINHLKKPDTDVIFHLIREILNETPKGLGPAMMARMEFTEEISWSLPSREALDAIVAFVKKDEKVLSVGSGRAFWELLLRRKGINIISTDKEAEGFFLQNEKLEGEAAAKKHKDCNVLFMSWPLYDHPMAHDALDAFAGDKLIYIGEREGGCTGDNDFFELLESSWKLAGTCRIPKWYSIHDQVWFYERNK